MKFCIRTISDFDDLTLREIYLCSSDARKTQILNLKNDEDKRTLLCADTLVRQMLSASCGLCPTQLQFARTESGKPYALNCDIAFNLSHSGQFVLCAIDSSPVGVDIEMFRPLRKTTIARVCTDEEQHYIADDPKRFIQIWTAKEAYLKYLGLGIRENLRNVNVVFENQIALPNLEIYTQTEETYAFSIVSEAAKEKAAPSSCF